MTRALDHGPSPVQGFATFPQNDWGAVVNGLTLHWSSGAVEGQVTRIKPIKRRSYGRASFALLRTLVLAKPPVTVTKYPPQPNPKSLCATNAKGTVCRNRSGSNAVQVMKVWPFGAALRGEASNHHMLVIRRTRAV